MDNHRIPTLNWGTYVYEGKSIEELRHSLLYTTLELESTRLAAQEEIRRKEDQVIQLKDLLTRAIRERDEANDKCQSLLVEKLILLQHHHHHQNPQSGVSSIEDGNIAGDSNAGLSSSECEESIVSSPDTIPPPPLPEPDPPVTGKLPEKGKLLQAVMKAGPLLQTLLLAGPLPQWRHPPPPLGSFEIPPVTIPIDSSPQNNYHNQLPESPMIANNNQNTDNKKRALLLCQSSEPSTNKYQKVILH